MLAHVVSLCVCYIFTLCLIKLTIIIHVGKVSVTNGWLSGFINAEGASRNGDTAWVSSPVASMRKAQEE